MARSQRRWAPALLCAAAIAATTAYATAAQAHDPETEAEEREAQRPAVVIDKDPYPSTYAPLPSQATVIRDATLLDGRGGRTDGGMLLMADGKIVALGTAIDIPADALVIDGEGKWLTPGIIDVHSHLGVYASPSISAHSDGNESTSPVTPEVWAEHSVWPQDPGFIRALAGGVTTLQILPGSANLFGGRSAILKTVPSRTVQGMKFPGAPYGLKMACGENPKRVYGDDKGSAPSTRMGNFAGYRKTWFEALAYQREWQTYATEHAAGEDPDPPERDLGLETLMGVLDGEILVHMHCYRADEMALVIDMAKEVGYRVGTFHHAIESYKIADLLKAADVCSAMWADWWGFKIEAYDAIRENIPWVHQAGACAIVHSDSARDIQHLNQEAAKALADARKAGVEISKAAAWTWLSHNPAKALGIAAQTGSLAAGMNADLVLWSGDPFSVYSKAEKVFIDGALLWDLDDPTLRPVSDFELGQPGEGDVK